ncbi:hypothetical protein NUBL22002_45650 [Klebsiella variicola]|nr:hypothetical protein NUBL22002_45650 [Klebsiella variicola]
MANTVFFMLTLQKHKGDITKFDFNEGIKIYDKFSLRGKINDAYTAGNPAGNFDRALLLQRFEMTCRSIGGPTTQHAGQFIGGWRESMDTLVLNEQVKNFLLPDS